MGKKRQILVIFIVTAFVLATGALAVVKYREYQNQLHMEEVQEMAYLLSEVQVELPEEEEVVIPIDFGEIRKENPDIVAWVCVPGTAVDYPILQSAPDMEEDYYLEHNLDGSPGYPGCIYIQKMNQADFCDAVTVVYGHNMKNGTMFAGLHQFEDRTFFDENDTFEIYTPTSVLSYQVIASVNYDNRLIPVFYHFFQTTSDVADFLDDLYAYGEGEKNHFAEAVKPDAMDRYVILSTCSEHSKNRWLVVGKQIQE